MLMMAMRREATLLLLRAVQQDEVERLLFGAAAGGSEPNDTPYLYFLRRLFRLSVSRFPFWSGTASSASVRSGANVSGEAVVGTDLTVSLPLSEGVHERLSFITDFPLTRRGPSHSLPLSAATTAAASASGPRQATAVTPLSVRLPALPTAPIALLIRRRPAEGTAIQTPYDLRRFFTSHRPFWGTRLDVVVHVRLDVYIPFPLSLHTVVQRRPLVAMVGADALGNADAKKAGDASANGLSSSDAVGASAPITKGDGAATAGMAKIGVEEDRDGSGAAVGAAAVPVVVFRVHCSCHPRHCDAEGAGAIIVHDVTTRVQFASTAAEADVCCKGLRGQRRWRVERWNYQRRRSACRCPFHTFVLVVIFFFRFLSSVSYSPNNANDASFC